MLITILMGKTSLSIKNNFIKQLKNELIQSRIIDPNNPIDLVWWKQCGKPNADAIRTEFINIGNVVISQEFIQTHAKQRINQLMY